MGSGSWGSMVHRYRCSMERRSVNFR
jgi:hypothetical protein